MDLLDITEKINHTEIMRVFARIVLGIALFVLLSVTCKTPVHAQTTTTNNYFSPNADPNVPVNHHSYSQIVFIDTVSAIMCQLTGIDPTDPDQPCLGVNPATGKIAVATPANTQTFGEAQTPQMGGVLGLMASSIGVMYTPAVSSTQYVGYLADNFGIVKDKAYAASALPNCTAIKFGYGFCGLGPIFTIWESMRDFAYAILTILFIAIGVGVMLRFRVDPRTVMTLQNQIPRVIIAILLITFSYAIAGIMIDLMWTVTYTGINFITDAAPATSTIDLCDGQNGQSNPKPISQQVDTKLLDQPISFTNTVFRSTCGNGLRDSNAGLLKLADKVSSSLGDLVTRTVHDLLFPNGNKSCHISFWQVVTVIPAIGQAAKCTLSGVALNFVMWFAEQIVKIIVIIAILQALFRLWFQLIKTYLTFIIFVILGPIWIVLGLIPGRPMGFEKWLRIIFANLAVFPVVAFLLVFARVLVDAASIRTSDVFIPPLVGNPNISTFASFMGLGAIMMSPAIPDMIKDRMKAKGQTNFGGMLAGSLAVAAAAGTNPAKAMWKRSNARTAEGEAIGLAARAKDNIVKKIPIVGRRAGARKQALQAQRQAYMTGGSAGTFSSLFKQYNNAAKKHPVISRIFRRNQGAAPTQQPHANASNASPAPVHKVTTQKARRAARAARAQAQATQQNGTTGNGTGTNNGSSGTGTGGNGTGGNSGNGNGGNSTP